MRYIKFLLLSLGLIIGLLSCDNQVKESDPKVFKSIVDWHTEKDIRSIKSEIEIRINASHKINELSIDQLNDIFTITPKIKGSVEVIAGTTFKFIPKENLDFNTLYHVSFNLNRIMKDSITIEPFNFDIQTRPLDINVIVGPLETYSSDYQFSKVNIKSSDVLTTKTLKNVFQLNSNSGFLKLIQDDDLEYQNFTLIIDSLKRDIDDYSVNFSWDGSVLGSSSKGEVDIIVTGKNTFSVLQVEVEQEPNQVIQVFFSDPILKNQNFDGLVNIEETEDLEYKVDGSKLKIYLKTRSKSSKLFHILKGIKNTIGYSLKSNYDTEIFFEELKPSIKLLDNGSILPSSKNLFLNFETSNLYSVNVKIIKIFENNILQFLQYNGLSGNSRMEYVGKKINTKTIELFKKGDINAKNKSTHSLDLSKIIKVDPNAIYRVELSFNPSNSAYDCEETPELLKMKSYYDEYDGSYYSDYDYSNINYSEKENPCTQSFYYYNSNKTSVATNILATNIGITVKADEYSNYHFAAVNMVTNTVMPTTTIRLYSLQQQLLGEVQTNSKGLAKIKIDKETPYFAIASHQNDKVYLKLNDGNALSLSKFNVSGASLNKGLKGFIYLDRGVRRPGDHIPVTFILDDSKNTIPDNHPVVFELYNPQGKLVKQKVVKIHKNHVYSHVFKSNQEDVTGNWKVIVKVGGAQFTRDVKIETIKPNRLKINARFGGEKTNLDLSDNLKGELEVTWLHGAIAGGLKSDVTLKVSSQETKFENFPNYYFGNEARDFSGEETMIFDGDLDDNGKAEFNLEADFNNRAPGFLKANFLTKVYEKGGDFSTHVESKIISPYQTYIGMALPKAKNRYNILYTDENQSIDLISVNSKGEVKPNSNLKVRVFKINWRWWWHSGRDNLLDYVNSTSYRPVYSTEIKTNDKGKGVFNLNMPSESWGRYFIYVENIDGKHAVGKTLYIDWPNWEGRAASGNASSAAMLSFTTDKTSYQVGEIATVSIPSTEAGRALISIENGSEVLDMQWVETSKGETKFTWPITEKMTPNIYFNISLLQKHSQTKNDIPIRTYGVQGVEVINPNTKLHPVIKMPESLRPEQEFEIDVSESKGQLMTYTIQIVDEGLLDLTRYRTPNPWPYFYAKEALGITTWDVYDDVIGAYGGTLGQIFSIGGDGDVAGSKAKKANRFDPVAIHLGPFELPANGSKTHKITLPNYVGSVKTMVVASNTINKAYGSSEIKTPVKKPVMVLVSAPRVLAPGEKFVLPVNVFVMEDHIKEVEVNLQTNTGLKIIGESTKKVAFTRSGDKVVNFNVEVVSGTPIGKLSVLAKSGHENGSSDIEINIENPNPISSIKQTQSIDNSGVKILEFETFGEENSNSLEIEFSNFHPINLSGRLGNLIRYPHGCLEQTTSKVFPQLYLSKIVDLPDVKLKKTQYYINKALTKLASFQQSNGSLSYWPHSSYYESWAEVYASHFIVEAEANGYVLPLGFKNQLLSHLGKQAKIWNANSDYSNTTQAYRLFVLAKANKPEISAMNRLREVENLSDMAKYRLAHAYILIGQNYVAKTIIADIGDINYNMPNGFRSSFGSIVRNKALVLETDLALGNLIQAQALAKEISDALNDDSSWMSTQTAAYAIRSMALFSEAVKTDGLDLSFSIDNDNKGDITSLNSIELYSANISKGKYALKVENKKEGPLFVSMVINGKYPVGTDFSESRGLTISTQYKTLEGNLISIDSLKQGTNFMVEVSVKNNKHISLTNVALSQLFPSGWEVINTRFTDFGMPDNDLTDYIDIRDSKVNYFFDLERYKTKTFNVMINASYIGEYYLPGVQSEAMYNNDFFVRGKGRWIKIVE